MTNEAVDHDELLYFNGINGATGRYGLDLELTASLLSEIIKEETDYEELEEFKLIREKMTRGTEENPSYGPKEGVDGTDLAQAGWGIIFAHDDADSVPAIKEALSDLLKLRQEQAGQYFKVFEGKNAYRPGETHLGFLGRHGVSVGPVDPDEGVPYYLLIVGSPEVVPYHVQYQLDVQFAVGRIHFETLQEYANYARSVVAAETGTVKLPRKVSFFGVANPDDRTTELSAKHLVQPLYDKLKKRKPDWEVKLFLREEARKAQLEQLIGGDQTPALLFTTSHGMEFPLGDPRQIPHQGALLCQDWPGPEDHRGHIPQRFYFAGDDLDSEAGLLGLMTFHFACYGAGTPQYDEFAEQAFKESTAIAERPFVAGLPKKLLSHPRGGALAVVGHVERAWGYSFFWPRAGKQTTVFESTLERLLLGHPIGSAFEYFNERYAELSSVLSGELYHIGVGGREYNPYELAGLWTANNDARNYVIIGDPAVRLPVVAEHDEAPSERPIIEVESPPTLSATPSKEAAIKTAVPKPEGISNQDWQKTPLAVQQLVDQLLKRLDTH